MPKPLVSAIIPAYNAAATIATAIDSVRAQTYENMEIVVCNDGSSDDTARVVQESYPEVVYLEQENSGPSVARNRAAEAASGEFLACLDADDKWAPQKTERQLQVMLDSPTIGATTTAHWVIRGGYRYPSANPRKPRVREMTLRDLFRDGHPHGPTAMVRADAFRAVGGYDPQDGVNLGLWCRLLAMGYRFVYLNELLYLYHVRPGSLSSRRFPGLADETLHVLAELDPRREDLPWTSPLTQAEHSWFVGERLAEAALICIRHGRHQRAHGYLRRLGELQPLAPVYRLQRWASAISWPLFTIAAGAHRAHLRVCRRYRHWGLLGALRHGWELHIAPRRQC